MRRRPAALGRRRSSRLPAARPSRPSCPSAASVSPPRPSPRRRAAGPQSTSGTGALAGRVWGPRLRRRRPCCRPRPPRRRAPLPPLPWPRGPLLVLAGGRRR
eukprot:6178088-Pleurochrysis_carterae.AAC.1